MKKDFGSTVAKAGIVLIDESFYVFFTLQNFMYFFLQFSFSDTMNYNKRRKPVRDCEVVPLFKFPQLNGYNFKIFKVLVVVCNFFYVQVYYTSCRLQVLTYFFGIVNFKTTCSQAIEI